jgi:hypothetical protein
MKGNISLKQFIQEVKQELVDAQDSSNPFYELHEVQLEVSFALEIEGGGKAKFVVVELGANTTASQLHRVIMKFVPLDATTSAQEDTPVSAGTSDKPMGSGGEPLRGGFLKKKHWKPVYGPD